MTPNEARLEAENKVLADAVASLSRKITVRRAISSQRLEVITTQTRTIADQDEVIKQLETINVERLNETRDAHNRSDKVAEKLVKLGHELKGAQSTADMWLDQVHQRDKHITDANQKISELRERIKQGDEELRLLMCDIHPDGRARGHISMMDKIEHVAGEANRFAQSKIERLQHRNQEIGSQLGYYKMKTGDLRAAINVSESVIKNLRNETMETHKLRTMLVNAQASRDAWKRKYHTSLAVIKPVRIDLADLTVGRNADV